MRYALLDQLACPACLAPLICVTETEIPSPMPVGRPSGGSRVSHGPGIGPAPAWSTSTALTSVLDRLAGPPAPINRADAVEVESGLLICACGRWFPIEHSIPELLPDHLRDTARDAAILDTITSSLPDELASDLRRFRPDARAEHDEGAHHKKAEIGITGKSPTRRSSLQATVLRSPTGIPIFRSTCSSCSVPLRRCWRSPGATA